jgi:hypothetical protein
MSYAIYLYHPEVKDKASQGLDLDAFEHPALPESTVQRFLARLSKYGYRPEHQSPDCQDFVKNVGTCPVQVRVFKTEIAFSVPFSNDFQNGVFEALQTSAELCDADDLVTYNPQEGTWGP